MTLALLNYSSDLQAILYIRSLPQMEKQDFQTVFPDANPMGEFEEKNSNGMKLQLFVSLAIDLMEKMLEVDSDKRINAAQTLSHPYLEEVCFRMF